MKYNTIQQAEFISRPNRFISLVRMDGKTVVCHVKNTGRCRELLLPGASVFVEKSTNPRRKTAYSLIAVQKGERLINMDSQAPNAAVKEWLEQGGLFADIRQVRPETIFGASRFDFFIERPEKDWFIEVKGVTLEENGVVLFPDAPTERGVKHVKELSQCVAEGYGAAIIFVIQMKGVQHFTPNRRTDPAFAAALLDARQKGVMLYAWDCIVTPDSMQLSEPVKIIL